MSERRREWVPVAVWECQRMLKRKDFVIWTLVSPLLIVGILAAIGWFKERASRRITRIAVVSLAPGVPGGVPAAGVELPRLKGFEWVVPAPEERGIEALIRAVREKKLAGALLLPTDLARGGKVEAIVYRGSPPWRTRVSSHLEAHVRRTRAGALGLSGADLDRLDAPLRLEERLADPSRRSSRGDRLAAVFAMMLLIMSLFITNSYLAIGISGEKQARVTEVIVSAIRPQAWIDGKIVAYTVIGLAQTAIWGLTLVGVGAVLSTMPPAVHPRVLVPLGLFVVLGFAFYVSLWAVVLATVKDLQSTSKFQAYLIMMPMVPLVMIEPLLENPDGPWMVAMSLVPFFSPLMVPARMALNAVVTWEVVAALAALTVSAYYLRLAAGHAFRIGMLMYGKELSLPELAKWARRS